MKGKITQYSIQQSCEDKEIVDFKIASFNELSCTATEFEENHRHEYFEIIWLKDGCGTHQIDLYEHSYRGSVLFILAPGQIHKIQQKEISEGYIVKFMPSVFSTEGDFFNFILDTCLFDSASSCPVIKIPKSLIKTFEELFLHLINEFNQFDIDSGQLFSSYLKILITHINRLKRKKVGEYLILNDPQYTLFREFKILIEKNFKKQHSVQYYSDFLSVQARALNTVSRKFTDKSAGEMIQERVILEAKRSLYHEAKTIKEICFELGFEDPAYFTRFFKKHTGFSPLQFKEQKMAIA